jgi:hypothetical protein
VTVVLPRIFSGIFVVERKSDMCKHYMRVEDGSLHLLNNRKFVQAVLLRFMCFSVSITRKSIIPTFNVAF